MSLKNIETLIIIPTQLELDAFIKECNKKGMYQKSADLGALQLNVFVELHTGMALGGFGKTQFAVQTQYCIDRMDGLKRVLCVGASGGLISILNLGDVVIGTETLPSISFVTKAVESFGSNKIIVSLDLMGNKVLSDFELDKLAEPMKFLRELEKRGVTQIIVLDLAKVGSNEGVNSSFLQEVIRNIKARILVGGGVRDIEDLMELQDLGVSGVLVATALHKGNISADALKQAGLL